MTRSATSETSVARRTVRGTGMHSLITWMVVGACLQQVRRAGADPVVCETRNIAGKVLDVVRIDLRAPGITVRPELAFGFDDGKKMYPTEEFSAMIHRLEPAAAINGTFFDTVSKKPVGSIVIDGQLVHNGDRGTAVRFMEDGQVDFRLVSGTPGSRQDWTGCRAALCSGPTLLIDGRIHLKPQMEGFRDFVMLHGRANRSALGVTADYHLLLVRTRGGVSLDQLASLMRSLGAINSVNLDGGPASALYCRGRVLGKPAWKLTNILAIYDNQHESSR